MGTNVLELCVVCKESMTDPRILPCAHSFCLQCLECSAISKKPPKCPKCQIEFQIPEGGLKDLKKNEFIEQLNILKQSNVNHISCDSCKENQAIKFCVECSYNYCSICLEHHGRIPITSNHHLQPATIDKSKFRINVYSKCKEHSEDINLFCERCGVTVCGHCFYLNHNSHKMKHFADYFESMKHKIELNLEEKQLYLGNAGDNYNSSEITMNNNLMKASNLIKEIKQRGENLKKAVDSIVDELIENVDKKVKQHQKEADGVMKELRIMEAKLMAEMRTLKYHLNNMNYQNVAEVPKIECSKISIPKYSKQFDISLSQAASQEISSLKTMFGSLKEESRDRQIKYQAGFQEKTDFVSSSWTPCKSSKEKKLSKPLAE